MRERIYIICTILSVGFATPALQAQDSLFQAADAITAEESIVDVEIQSRLAEVREQRAILRQRWAEKLKQVSEKGPDAIRQSRDEFIAENSEAIESLRLEQSQLLSDIRGAGDSLDSPVEARSASDLPEVDNDVLAHAASVRDLREAMNAELAARIEELESVTPESLKKVREEVLVKYADQLAALRSQGDIVRLKAGKGPPHDKHPHGMPPGLAKKQEEMRQLRDQAQSASRSLGQVLQEIMTDQSLSKEEKRERAQDAKRIWKDEQKARREEVKELRRQLRELDERD